MDKSKPLAVFLTALMILSVGAFAIPAAAQPSWSASGGSASANAGDTVDVTFSVSNNGDETGSAEVTVQNGTLPSGWSVTGLSADDPNPADQFAVINNPPTYVFSDANAGETVTVTATVDVPGSASDGDYTLDATVTNATSGVQVATISSTISVGTGSTTPTPTTPTPTTPTPTPAPGDGDVSIERVNVIDGSAVAGGGITTHNAATSSNDDLVEVRFDQPISAASAASSWSVEFEDGSTEAADSVDVNGAGDSATMQFAGGFDNGEAFNVSDVVLNGGTVTPVGGSSTAVSTDEEVDNIATSGAAENNANKSVFIGESIAIITDSTDENVFIQNEDGAISAPGTTNNNQIVIFESEGSDAGEYHVDFDGEERQWSAGGDEVVLNLRDLNLDIEADDTSIDEDDDAEATVSAFTNGREIRLGVMEDDGDFVSGMNMTETLEDSLGEPFNFGPIEDSGTYTYYVEDLSTGISAESDEVSVDETDEDVEFTQTTFSDHRGDAVNITIEMTDTDTATISMGPYDDLGYSFNATVENDDDDDEVTLQWNTFAVDDNTNTAAELSVPDEDDNLLHANINGSDVGGSPDDIVAPGTYDLQVRLGGPGADEEDVATASLQQRSTDGVITWTAPGAAKGDVEEKEDVYDRVGINITEDSSIAEGDLLITQIEASGLEGAIKASSDDPTAGFKAIEDQEKAGNVSNVLSLKLEQTDTQLNRQPRYTDYSQAHNNNANAVALIPDYDNDTYFVVWDLDQSRFTRGDSSSTVAAPEDGNQFEANLTVFSYEQNRNDYGLVGPVDDDFADEEVLSSWEFVDAENEIDLQRGDLVRVQAAANQTISGTSTLATGSEIDVRLQTVQGANNAFLLGPEDVTVEDGTWSTEFDFSDRQTGTEFEAEVRDDVADTVTEDGIIQDQPVVQALTFSDQESGGSSVVVQEVQLSDGGFVAIHEGSASGDVVGVTRYIDPGEEATNLGVGLDSSVSDGDTLVAMPHLDTNTNERFDFPDADGPYTEGGSPVTESATISVGGDATPPPTPTPEVITPTPMETPTPEVQTVMVTPEETPGQDGPGFGVVVALIALIAAALLAVRRNN